jgi:hypothetical protein
MRRYKIVACILLILPVSGFVHAAPVAVQEVREACADVVNEGDNVIIGSGKRAEVAEEEDPLLAAQQEPSSSSDSTLSQHQGPSSALNYASMTDPNPSFSSGESKPAPSSTSGGTELSWINPEGESELFQPGTSTEVQPASTSKAKSVSFAPSMEVILPSGEKYSEALPPDIEPLPRPLFLDLWQAKMAAQQSPKPKNTFSKLVGKLKFWRRSSGTAGGVVTEG